jgi:hypothetical protein
MEEKGNNVLQCLTEYKLSDKEMALLEVLLSPEYRMRSITDICKIAGISRPTYYSAFAKPAFREIYKQKSKELVDQAIAPVLNTFVREALRGSFQHGKVILEMAGLYSEKSELEINNNLNLNVTLEGRKERIKELLSKAVQESAIETEYKILDEPAEPEQAE